MLSLELLSGIATAIDRALPSALDEPMHHEAGTVADERGYCEQHQHERWQASQVVGQPRTRYR